MNLVADEGVDRAVVERLRRGGHEVVYVAELSPSVTDEGVLQEASATKAEIAAEVCRDRTAELVRAFSVVSPGQVRIR